YGTLVNPNRAIPPLITSITGIQTSDVADAPRIEAAIPALRSFLGQAALIGHNIGFDVAFLQRQGIVQNNARIDTYDLASVLLPRAPRYNLTSLTSLIEVDLAHAHRALDDARACGQLYYLLWGKVLAL